MITGISKGVSQASECEIPLGESSASLPCRSESMELGFNWPLELIFSDAVEPPGKLGYRAEYENILYVLITMQCLSLILSTGFICLIHCVSRKWSKTDKYTT